MAAPMLREPPVTSATLPVSFFAMFVFIFIFQMSFSNCESGIDGCVSRRNCLTGQGRGCRGVFHETGEMFAVAPEQEQGKQRNHDRHRQSRRCHQDVEAKDVHDYRTDQCEAKWRPPTGEQEDAAHDLQCADDIKVVADKQSRHEISRRAFRRGAIWMKWKNMFEPNTTKISPSRLRAMIVAIFI